MNHRWTKCDDIIALYLYKYGAANIGSSIEQLAKKLGISVASMKMRVQNFKSVDIGGGLPNMAQQSRSIFISYGGLSELELRSKVLECLKKV
jgi:hypothetical protein